MGRHKGSINTPKQSELITLSEEEKLSLVADLLLELVIDEFNKNRKTESCKTA